MTKPKPRHGAPVPGPPCPRPSPPTLATTRPRLNCVPSRPAIKSSLRAAVLQKSRHVHISTIEIAPWKAHCRQEQKERERLVVTILHSHHKFGTPFRIEKKIPPAPVLCHSRRNNNCWLGNDEELAAKKKKKKLGEKRKEDWRCSNCRRKEVNFQDQEILLCFCRKP